MTSFVDRLLGRAGTSPASTATVRAVGVTPVPYLDASAALGLSAVWRSVTLIADSIADMPWQEWKGDQLLAPSRLVRRPFLGMTRREWTWRVVATEALYNATYLLHVGGTDAQGAPWSLMPVPPTLIVAAATDPWGLLPPEYYVVAGQRVPADQVTVIRRAPFPGISDSMSGLLDIARREFTAYVAADVHLNRYWSAGGPTTTIITTEQELDTPQADAIRQRWLDSRALGADHPAVLGKGAHAEAWGADPTTESAVEARREIVADVGRYFGIPTRTLNAPAGDSETYSNVEFDAIDLLRLCLRGYMGPIEDAISEELPGDPLEGRRMQLDPARFIQGDLGTRTTAWTALVASGIADVDEARVRGFALPARGTAAPVATTPDQPAVQEGVTVNG